MEEHPEPKAWVKYLLAIAGTLLLIFATTRLAYVDRELENLKTEIRQEQHRNTETQVRLIRVETQIEGLSKKLDEMKGN